MPHLHVFYALDDNYAPYCGVSITSLFENNQSVEALTVHVMSHNICSENLEKILTLGRQYHREILIYDAVQIVEKIEALGMCLYRGSYATNIRLFFSDVISIDSDRLLYLDSDTIVTGDLSHLLEFEFGQNVCAAVQESLSQRYKKLIQFEPSAPYFNAGVLLIHVPKWKQEECSLKISHYIRKISARSINNDQDIINIVFKNQIGDLGPRYNFQPTHLVYSYHDFRTVYHPQNYYTQIQVENAAKSPAIVHTYRFIGQFPWHDDTLHPNISLFETYLAKSPWCSFEKLPLHRSSFYQIEKQLYLCLPKRVFLRMFAFVQYLHFSEIKRKCEKFNRKIGQNNETG